MFVNLVAVVKHMVVGRIQAVGNLLTRITKGLDQVKRDDPRSVSR